MLFIVFLYALSALVINKSIKENVYFASVYKPYWLKNNEDNKMRTFRFIYPK